MSEIAKIPTEPRNKYILDEGFSLSENGDLIKNNGVVRIQGDLLGPLCDVLIKHHLPLKYRDRTQIYPVGMQVHITDRYFPEFHDQPEFTDSDLRFVIDFFAKSINDGTLPKNTNFEIHVNGYRYRFDLNIGSGRGDDVLIRALRLNDTYHERDITKSRLLQSYMKGSLAYDSVIRSNPEFSFPPFHNLEQSLVTSLRKSLGTEFSQEYREKMKTLLDSDKFPAFKEMMSDELIFNETIAVMLENFPKWLAGNVVSTADYINSNQELVSNFVISNFALAFANRAKKNIETIRDLGVIK